MPPEQSEEAAIQDPHRLVQCQARPEFLWVQHHNGIFRSRDGGLHWQGVVAEPSSFGFAVAVHPRQPDTAWFVPATKDECRIPRDARFVVTRTRDGGHSFETLERGLPDGPAYDLVYRHGLDIDPSGERLAMGLDHRRPVAQRERRGGLAAALRQPAADLLRALRLSARRWTASARLHKFVGFRQGAHPHEPRIRPAVLRRESPGPAHHRAGNQHRHRRPGRRGPWRGAGADRQDPVAAGRRAHRTGSGARRRAAGQPQDQAAPSAARRRCSAPRTWSS